MKTKRSAQTMRVRDMLGVIAVTVILITIGFTAGRMTSSNFTMDYSLPIEDVTKRINR